MEASGLIAANLRRLRLGRGLSQAQLAARGGVSRQVVVLLENGRANPRVSSLADLAGALGVSLAALVEQSSSPVFRVVGPEEFTVLWRGAKGSRGEMMAASAGHVGVEIWRWILEAGTTYRAAGERAEEFLFVVSGDVFVKVDGTRHSVSTGQVAVLPGRTPYTVRAGSSGALVVLVFVPERSG